MAAGACNCGTVRFTIAAELKDLYACHCSICRGWTGTGGVTVAVVPLSAFRWETGEDAIVTWRKPDADWESHFCRHCGAALPGPNDEATMFIPAGSLRTGTEHLKVAHHIWVSSKADWDEIGDDGQRHPHGFGSG